MLDDPSDTRDNVYEPIPQQKGKYIQIKRDELPEGWTFCKKHDEVPDPTETHDHMQGYICKNCGRGRLVKL